MTEFEQIMDNQDRCLYVYDNGLVCLARRRHHHGRIRAHEFQASPPTIRQDVARWMRRARSFFRKRPPTHRRGSQ